MIMASNVASMVLLDRVRGALYGLLIADALAMPTHWYYGGESQVRQDYGGLIKGYVAPPLHMSGSIMGKSNTGGDGRGSDKGTIIGDVINHGKRKFWKTGSSYHYHQGMAPGDNTLEAVLTRNVIRATAEKNGEFDAEGLLKEYVSFMMRPGSHNDTYASTAHRMFFRNLVERGLAPDKCPDNDRHNVDTTDAITMALPIALLAADDSTAEQQAAKTVTLTRSSRTGEDLSRRVSRLLRSLVKGADLRTAVKSAAGDVNYNVERDVTGSRSDPVTAWYRSDSRFQAGIVVFPGYLPGSFHSCLFMCYKYGWDASASDAQVSTKFEQALLANANRGGENVAVGALIGAVLGAAAGYSRIPPHLIDGLARSQRPALDHEIHAFAQASPFVKSGV